MRRVTDFLLRNWPLRLGAILLATVLYTGIVLGQNVRTWGGQLPVDPIRPPAGATLLSDLAPVTQVRYRAPLDIGVLSPDSFHATVDLSRVSATPGGEAVTVPVTVVALDTRIQIVDFTPHGVAVQLDPVEVREMPISVSLGSVADGLTLGPPQVDPGTVTLRGASSRIDQVSQVVARVSIDASALNVDREVELIAVDGNGNQVSNVEIDPQRARVRIAVARELANRSLPVVPILTGVPAVGYRISAISVAPLVVTLSGEASILGSLESAPTQPINVEGRSTDLEANVNLNLPSGISVNGSDQVKVMLTIVEETGTRTFVMGFTLEGTKCVCVYGYEKIGVAVTLGGPITALQAVDEFTLAAQVDVTGLGPGSHVVPLTMSPPDGLLVISIDPTEVSITVEAATPVPGPT